MSPFVSSPTNNLDTFHHFAEMTLTFSNRAVHMFSIRLLYKNWTEAGKILFSFVQLFQTFVISTTWLVL